MPSWPRGSPTNTCSGRKRETLPGGGLGSGISSSASARSPRSSRSIRMDYGLPTHRFRPSSGGNLPHRSDVILDTVMTERLPGSITLESPRRSPPCRSSLVAETAPITLTPTLTPPKFYPTDRSAQMQKGAGKPAPFRSGRIDLNYRPLDPQSSALTRLRYAPTESQVLPYLLSSGWGLDDQEQSSVFQRTHFARSSFATEPRASASWGRSCAHALGSHRPTTRVRHGQETTRR
jgi:hypothetical protein